MKLNTPYYSQFIDVQDSFWMIRACGGVCLKIVAEWNGKIVPDIVSLCNEAKERSGYDMHNGWVHDYIVTRAQEFGLQAYRKEGIVGCDEIIASLDAGNPVIVSVEKRVLEQTRFHMIVVVGYEQGEDVESVGVPELANSYKLKANSCFYYHESESTDREKGQYRVCSKETFLEYFRGKAIFISK